MSRRNELWATANNLDTAQPESHNSDNGNQTSLIEFLCGSLTILWKEWPKQMRCTLLDKDSNRFSLNGVCPHCRRDAVFMTVAGVFSEYLDTYRYRHCAAMRCQGCLRFILGVVGSIHSTFEYLEHYPLGKPDDSIDEHIKEPMASNFREAIRCLWVDAHKAAVAMCRRAVEASCNNLGAKGQNLKRKIDNLADRRVITESLQRMAHAVRITANEQLHGKGQDSENAQDVIVNDPKAEIITSDLDTFTKDDAEEVIKFTQQFFHFVYVMPALLEKHAKPKGEASDGA